MPTPLVCLLAVPARNPRTEGKELFNAAFLLYEKEIKAEIHKTLLPTYDVFDENRYFEPAFEWKCIEFRGKSGCHYLRRHLEPG
jgi:NAD+ synthase (glutamine-hydrolysing)